MSTSPSTEPLRRRFAGPGLSRSATPPMFKLLRLDNRYHFCKITYAEAAMVRLSLSMTLTFNLGQSELSFFPGGRFEAEHLVPEDAQEDLCPRQLQHGSGKKQRQPQHG